MKNTILHIDMDAFYASVEQRNHPEYRNKPLVVGGPSSRGVVCSASYDARAFGVKSAMPIITAKRLCPQAIFVLPNMKIYQEESNKIMSIMNRFTPLVEPISLDEAYLEVGGSQKLFGSAEVIGKKIQTAIQEELQLSSSVGVAPNKFLAKIASDMKKPKGFFILNWQERHQILDALPITAVAGIGKKTAEVVSALGIKTIKDLRLTPKEVLRTCLGNQTEHFLRMANGEDDRPVTLPDAPLSVGREHTFGEDIYKEEHLRSYLQGLADDVGSRLRKQNFSTHTITVKVKYADFTLITRSITIEQATNQTKTLYQIGLQLLEKVKDINKKGVRLLGLSAGQLVTSTTGQLYLFEDPVDQKQQTLDKVMDNIRNRYGQDCIFPGGVLHTEKPKKKN